MSREAQRGSGGIGCGCGLICGAGDVSCARRRLARARVWHECFGCDAVLGLRWLVAPVVKVSGVELLELDDSRRFDYFTFAHTVGGIVGVAIGGVGALILGVLAIFFLCGCLRSRSPPGAQRAQGGQPTMRDSGACAARLRRMRRACAGTGRRALGTSRAWWTRGSEGHGSGSGSVVGGARRASLVVRARTRADALRTGGRGARGRRAGDVLSSGGRSGSGSGSGRAASSSQGHSRGGPPSSLGYSSNSLRPQRRRLVHLPRADEQPHVGLRTHDPALELLAPFLRRAAHPKILPAAAAAVSSQAAQDDGPKPPGLMWRLRGGRVLHRLPAAAVLRAGAQQDPSIRAARRARCSTRRARSSTRRRRSARRGARAAWGVAPAAGAAAAAAVACPHGWERGWRGRGTEEGLLRPGLAVLLPASHSIRSLGDHVDFTPDWGAVNVRMRARRRL
ncbi:hypothetical protein B0H14DRAFT_3555796 [Mycena olivaceomarginata]|nr:hypothetical protein B0H14DRAFT_3555796 [Mycena olivaceomarginata]